MIPVAILAGGLATRLGSLTAKTPKSLLPVAGRPFIARQLDLLRGQGLKKAVLCLGHLGGAIEAEAGDGRAFGLEVACSFDGPAPLGTAGALEKALPLLGETFFVLYGDSYLGCDFSAVLRAFEKGGHPALMTVYGNDGAYDKSNVRFENQRIMAYDKNSPTPEMRHIDYGLGVLTRRVFDSLPAGRPADLANLYGRLARAGLLGGFEVRERFYEIGSLEGLRELSALLEAGNGEARP